MQLRRVEVRNIRSYEHARLELSGGTTLLVGDVGSGKTSLLYAIEMALFGTAEIEATFLVRHGAAESTVLVALEDAGHQFEIERSFRRVRRRGREAFEPGRLVFREDGAATAYSSTELRARVIELLGFRDNPNPRAHSDLWRWAVYVPQEQMREILAAPPVERLETVRRALGVERYHLAAENAKEVARDLRQTAQSLRAQALTLREFAEDLDAATTEFAGLRGASARVDESLEAVDRVIGAARAASASADTRLAAVSGLRERLGVLTQQVGDVQRRLADSTRHSREREEELERLGEEQAKVAATAGDLPKLLATWEATEARFVRLGSEVEQQSAAESNWNRTRALREARFAELGRCQDDLAQVQQEVARSSRALGDLAGEGEAREPTPPSIDPANGSDVRLAEARGAERVAGERLALARQGLAELSELVAGGVCPRCHQTVRAEEFEAHEADARSAVRAAEHQYAEAQAEAGRRDAAHRSFEQYVRDHEAWEGRERRRREVEAGLDRSRARLAALETRFRQASIDVETLDGQLASLGDPTRALNSVREEHRRTQASLQAARKDVEGARGAESRLMALRDQAELLRTEEGRARAERESLARSQQLRSQEVRGLEDQLADEPALRREAEARRLEVRNREDERQRLAEERGRLRGRLESAEHRRTRAAEAHRRREELSSQSGTVDSKAEWLATAFHEAVLTMERRVLERAQSEFERNFRACFASLMDDPDLVAVTDATFSPAAEIRGVETPAEALSGGERTSLALAYRLALSQVVRSLGGLRFDALLLDEPTDGFSPEQVQSMGQLLQTLDLPQVLLVSHERQLESVADRVVVVEKEGGTSVLRESGGSPTPLG